MRRFVPISAQAGGVRIELYPPSFFAGRLNRIAVIPDLTVRPSDGSLSPRGFVSY
jgi:hypothetical protein